MDRRSAAGYAFGVAPDQTDLYRTAQDLARRGRHAEAQARIVDLLAREPGYAAAWGLLGALHTLQGRPGDALLAYERAVALGDDDPRTHLGQGLAFLASERSREALPHLERAIVGDPGLVRAHTGRAQALSALGRATEALESADAALAIDPVNTEGLRRRGLALFELDQPEAALAAFRAMPTTGSPAERADVLADIGLAHEGLGQYAAALAAYDDALDVNPNAWAAPHRRAFVRLLHGDFEGGWSDYETRWRRRRIPPGDVGSMTPAFRERLLFSPTAADLAGQRVLVVAEQGIGDVVMFASALPDLAAIAAQVTCIVEPRLLTLLSVSFPTVKVVAGQGPALVDLSQIDRVVAIGSLPHAFRPTLAAFPGRPFLHPRPALTAKWRERLGPSHERLRVGVSWRGGTNRTRTTARSMPLEALRPVLARGDCEVVSLQYGDAAAEIADLNHTLERPLLAFPPRDLADFEQLAGLVSALDVVVTVQTALAHLTGAVGQTGLVMIPQRAEWRYGAEGSAMPWYGSLRLFRQDRDGDWPGVVARIGAALDRMSPRTAD